MVVEMKWNESSNTVIFDPFQKNVVVPFIRNFTINLLLLLLWNHDRYSENCVSWSGSAPGPLYSLYNTISLFFFSVQTINATAASGNEYKDLQQNVTFQPDEYEKRNISVCLVDDNTVEGKKAFKVAITSNHSQVIINNAHLMVTIIDNDQGILQSFYLMV